MRMRRLVLVFAGRTRHFVGFVVRRFFIVPTSLIEVAAWTDGWGDGDSLIVCLDILPSLSNLVK